MAEKKSAPKLEATDDQRPLRERVAELEGKAAENDSRDAANEAADQELADRVQALEEKIPDPPPVQEPMTREQIIAKMQEILTASGGFGSIPMNSEYWSLAETLRNMDR